MEPKELSELIAQALLDKRAKDVDVIEVGELTILADYFVICSSTSTTHSRALADEVERKCQEKGVSLLRTEGYEAAGWILLDFGSVVVNVFVEKEREFYNLERLWSDGKITRRTDVE